MKKGIAYFVLVSLMVFVLGLATASAVSIEVPIDIKPGSYPNSINLKSKGVTPVAILTLDDFDAIMVDAASVRLHPLTNGSAVPLRWQSEDVDYDGDLDLLLIFLTQEIDIMPYNMSLMLEGETFDGMPIFGIDSIKPVGMDQPK